MKRILAIANQKGGVGKTTTTVNLAASIAHAGHRVLVVDMDPQANATSGLGFPKGTLPEGVYEGLAPDERGIEAPRPLRELTQLTEVPNLWLVPSTRANTHRPKWPMPRSTSSKRQTGRRSPNYWTRLP